MTVAVTPFPLFSPPRNEIDIAVPTGMLMSSVSVLRVVGGLQTPIRQQPSAGFSAITVYDYECPYNQNVSYVATGNSISDTQVTEFTTAWANLTGWTTGYGFPTVSGGTLSFGGFGFIQRTLVGGSYRVNVANMQLGAFLSLQTSAGVNVLEIDLEATTLTVQIGVIGSPPGVEHVINGTFVAANVQIDYIVGGQVTITVGSSSWVYTIPAGTGTPGIFVAGVEATGSVWGGTLTVARYPSSSVVPFSYVSSVNLFDDGSGRVSTASYVAVGVGALGRDVGADSYFQASGANASGAGGLSIETMTIGAGKLLPNTTYTYSGTIDASAGSGPAISYVPKLQAAGTGLAAAVQANGPGGAFNRISITFTTVASGSVTFSVLNTGAAMAAGNTVAFRDAQMEIGPVATPYVAPGSSSQFQLSPASGWMIHPTVPAKSVPISTTDRTLPGVNNLGPVTSASSATVHEILGQSEPIISTSGPRRSDALTVIFAARTLAHEAQLNAILADQTPILFRFPDANLGWQDGFYAIGDVQRDRFAQVTALQRRLFTLPLRMVQPPPGSVQNPGWSWASVAATFSSWNEVALAYSSWADMASDNRNPGY